VSKYIHQATEEAAKEVASNLLPADRSEVQEGHGHDPETALLESLRFCESVYFKVPNGKIAGLAGVHSSGQIWMLCTPAIYDYPHTFAREARRFVEERREKLLWNIVDQRNAVHLKLLRFLGFKFLRRLMYGPNNLTFIEFARVQSSSNWSRRRRSGISNGSFQS
tara:strand:+ start:4687 stop:5181 length:495 start_codon:yes stop_codon:yes gene_type:complete